MDQFAYTVVLAQTSTFIVRAKNKAEADAKMADLTPSDVHEFDADIIEEEVELFIYEGRIT